MNPGPGFSIAFGRAREASSTSPPSDQTARREVEALHKPQSNGTTAGSKSGLVEASFRAPFAPGAQRGRAASPAWAPRRRRGYILPNMVNSNANYIPNRFNQVISLTVQVETAAKKRGAIKLRWHWSKTIVEAGVSVCCSRRPA